MAMTMVMTMAPQRRLQLHPERTSVDLLASLVGGARETASAITSGGCGLR